jgi:hypothetical protein
MATPTPADILSDQNLHALDYWVAEHVLGWRWFRDPRTKVPRRYLGDPTKEGLVSPARGDEPLVPRDPYRFRWSLDLGKAWAVLARVKEWPPDRRLRFLSGLAMQHDGSEDPLEWLVFGCTDPARAICRAALLASLDGRAG